MKADLGRVPGSASVVREAAHEFAFALRGVMAEDRLQQTMLLIHAFLAFAPFAPQAKPAPERPAQASQPKATKIFCTPTTMSCDRELTSEQRNPIAAALSRAAPGARIELSAGDYHGFDIGLDKDSFRNARTSGGTRAAPITVLGVGEVRIVAEKNAIHISQQVKNGFITFQHIDLVSEDGSAILFEGGEGWIHEGYRFLDCNISGTPVGLSARGHPRSKCGVSGRGLKDFEFRGAPGRAKISDLKLGDAFRLQNLRGDVLIENVDARRLGGSFIELTARPEDGPPGEGTLTIRNCCVEDCCISAGERVPGECAFSLAGQYNGTILLRGNRYRAGFDPELRKITRARFPYGTGALVAWDGEGAASIARLIIEGNDFEMQAACGDRPLVAVGACAGVEFRGANRFVAGANPAALEVEPTRKSRPEGSPVRSMWIDPSTQIHGTLLWRGLKVTLEELRENIPQLADPLAHK